MSKPHPTQTQKNIDSKNVGGRGKKGLSTAERTILEKGGLELMSECSKGCHTIVYAVPSGIRPVAMITIVRKHDGRVETQGMDMSRFMANRTQESPLRSLARQIDNSSLAQERIKQVTELAKFNFGRQPQACTAI